MISNLQLLIIYIHAYIFLCVHDFLLEFVKLICLIHLRNYPTTEFSFHHKLVVTREKGDRIPRWLITSPKIGPSLSRRAQSSKEIADKGQT